MTTRVYGMNGYYDEWGSLLVCPFCFRQIDLLHSQLMPEWICRIHGSLDDHAKSPISMSEVLVGMWERVFALEHEVDRLRKIVCECPEDFPAVTDEHTWQTPN